jgi:predicted Zn-dependent protease
MAIYQGLGMGMSLAVLGITRKSEAEADQLGTQYLWNSGYDPNGYISFFEKLQAREKNKPGKFASFFRTHPPVDDRITNVQTEIGFLPLKEEYVINTSEFDRVKARLVAIDNKLAAPGAAGSAGPSKRPTLKRKTNTDRSEREEPELQDDRPTLKRPSLKKQDEDPDDPDDGR